MKRLIAATALSALLATSAAAQTVSEDVSKQLWCGLALEIFLSAQTSLPPEQQIYLDGSPALVTAATQAHLDAGFTQAQVDTIVADLRTQIPTQFDDGSAPYAPEECAALIDAPSSADPSASSSAPSSAPSSAAPSSESSSDASSSSAM